jgi:hypothetical protein
LNIETNTICFHQGEPIPNPGRGVQLSVEVYRDDVIEVGGSTVVESGNGHCLNLIFNARVSGVYTISLKSNGVNVRKFPTRIRFF